MMSGFGWAKHPMINRINQLHPDIPMTLLYGSRSWVDNSKSSIIKEQRPNSFVNVQVKISLPNTVCFDGSIEYLLTYLGFFSWQVISGAGHHVYADKSDIFNQHVEKACQLADESSDTDSRTEKLDNDKNPSDLALSEDFSNKEGEIKKE